MTECRALASGNCFNPSRLFDASALSSTSPRLPIGTPSTLVVEYNPVLNCIKFVDVLFSNAVYGQNKASTRAELSSSMDDIGIKCSLLCKETQRPTLLFHEWYFKHPPRVCSSLLVWLYISSKLFTSKRLDRHNGPSEFAWIWVFFTHSIDSYDWIYYSEALTFQTDGGFNSPDPSRYCQDLGVKNSVAVLEDWIKNLDIDRHYPRLPDACNLAALVPHNECLRKLVELGADLSRMELEPGVANLLVKTDFNVTIAPKLWHLSSFGFELPQLSRIMTRVPKSIIKLPVEEVESRLKYFTDRGFSSGDVIRMVTDQPTILALTSCEVDRQLGTLMNVFVFKAHEIRHVASEAPKCIVQPAKSTKDIFVVLTKMMGFSVASARQMVIAFPRIILSSNRVLSTNAFHLHRRLQLSFDQIALFPRALSAPPRILAERTNFLKLCHLFQPDGTKPLYTPLNEIVEGTDEEFCLRFAKGKEKLFNDYLRTI
ncbi:Transcription termination factor 3 mitochondrial [Taenia crassiceps]|uniref:Transcription termination factor 3 mitochondrial n=1 Tax=Taenia crassiceps TaxID=6207 RepID=A0ABR4QDH1_9CEST